MPYVTSIERLGCQEDRQQVVLEILQARFGSVPEALHERLRSVRDEAELTRLLREAVLVRTLEGFSLRQ